LNLTQIPTVHKLRVKKVSEIYMILSKYNMILFYNFLFYNLYTIKFLSLKSTIQYALCRRNTINQAITINGKRERVMKGMREWGKHIHVRSHKALRTGVDWELREHTSDCAPYIPG